MFVDGKEESNVSVMEGDSVTLNPGVTDIQKKYTFEWRFKGIRIDTFGDRLQLNSQTGDLKISNIRTKDSGLYKVTISRTTGSPSDMEFNVKGMSFYIIVLFITLHSQNTFVPSWGWGGGLNLNRF